MTSPFTRSLAGLAVAGLLLTGCGSDSEEETEAGATTAPSTTAASSGPAAPEGDQTAAVTAAYKAYFVDFDPKALEDGDSFGPAIAEAKDKSVAAGGVSPQVKKVTVASDSDCEAAGVPAPCAAVDYDLLVNNTPALPDQKGYAVYQDGSWKVAKATFCALAAAGSGLPEGC